jgi:hypothetical protein
MIQYTAKNMTIDGTKITLDIEGKGTLTADMQEWKQLIISIGGSENIKKAKLLGDMLEFPNEVHIEIEDFISLAENQQKLPVSASLIKALHKIVRK